MFGRVLIALVRAYQLIVSPWTPAACRYAPTCSEYAVQAIRSHGAAKGAWLAVRRIGRCHPWGGHGYDPVPPTAKERSEPSSGERGDTPGRSSDVRGPEVAAR